MIYSPAVPQTALTSRTNQKKINQFFKEYGYEDDGFRKIVEPKIKLNDTRSIEQQVIINIKNIIHQIDEFINSKIPHPHFKDGMPQPDPWFQKDDCQHLVKGDIYAELITQIKSLDHEPADLWDFMEVHYEEIAKKEIEAEEKHTAELFLVVS